MHLALLVAGTRNINVEMERTKQAEWIFNTKNFYHDVLNNQIEVLSAKGDISVVNIENMSCSCFANSHGVHCFCLSVVEMIDPPVTPITSDYTYKEELNKNIEQTLPKSIDHEILGYLNEVSLFVHSDQFQHFPEKKKQNILNSMKNIHQICHFSDFYKKTNKRKQEPLNSNRKGKTNDHEYCFGTKQKVKKMDQKLHDDGSFKTEAKETTRVDFV